MTAPDGRIDGDRSALIVVDMQPDFLPGGALPVDQGDRILAPIARAMESGRFSLIVATQDWHPAGHISFASRHGKKPFESIELYGHQQTLWPDHCVQGSGGAILHPELPWDRVLAFVRKGENRAVDSYSGFRNNWSQGGTRPPTGLAGYLRERGIVEVHVCGLARDVCVRWTAEDAVDEGFATVMLWDLCRSVRPDGDDELRAALQKKGVTIAESTAVLGR